jgi:PTS system fructose-specific IIA component
VDFGAADGPSHLIFLIAAPASGGQEHMKILSKLARRLVHASFKESLLNAENEQKVADIVIQEVVNR